MNDYRQLEIVSQGELIGEMASLVSGVGIVFDVIETNFTVSYYVLAIAVLMIGLSGAGVSILKVMLILRNARQKL